MTNKSIFQTLQKVKKNKQKNNKQKKKKKENIKKFAKSLKIIKCENEGFDSIL